MTAERAGVVALSGVTREFGSVTAVRDLTLEIAEGDVIGLLGHNGAGKTTTLRLIDGVLAATRGTVRVFGMDPAIDGADVRRRTGVLLTQPSLDRRLTGRENLEFTARLHEVDRRHAGDRIGELTTSFHLDDRLDDVVGDYSAGMARRLALARMLLPNPSLLLLDEPTATLDPMAAHGVRQLISDLARAHARTVVMSTHDLTEAAAICDRVAVLQRGALVALGSPSELAGRVAARGLQLRVDDDAHPRIGELAATMSYTVEPIEDGAVRVHGVGYEDVPALVRMLVEDGIDIYGVAIDQPTLTDFYLALHGEESDVSEASSNAGGQL
ncbi:MAG TPA: ABC transporter ATP-binding protein [Euzebyales bacterium]